MRPTVEEFAMSGGGFDPMLPRPCRVEGVVRETPDTFTFALESGIGRAAICAWAVQHALCVRCRRAAHLD